MFCGRPTIRRTLALTIVLTGSLLVSGCEWAAIVGTTFSGWSSDVVKAATNLGEALLRSRNQSMCHGASGCGSRVLFERQPTLLPGSAENLLCDPEGQAHLLKPLPIFDGEPVAAHVEFLANVERNFLRTLTLDDLAVLLEDLVLAL